MKVLEILSEATKEVPAILANLKGKKLGYEEAREYLQGYADVVDQPHENKEIFRFKKDTAGFTFARLVSALEKGTDGTVRVYKHRANEVAIGWNYNTPAKAKVLYDQTDDKDVIEKNLKQAKSRSTGKGISKGYFVKTTVTPTSSLLVGQFLEGPHKGDTFAVNWLPRRGPANLKKGATINVKFESTYGTVEVVA